MKKSTLLLAAGMCLGISGFAQGPYLQDFEGTNPPTGWTLTNTDGTGWTFGHSAAISSSYFAATLPYELFNLNISTDGGTTWSVLDTPPAITTNAWTTAHYDLSAYA